MTTNRFSPVLVGGTALVTLGGVITGAVDYAHRSDVVEHHSSGTSAWLAHLILTGGAIAWLVCTALLARRRGMPLAAVLTAPWRRSAAARLRTAVSSVRVVPTAILLVLICYDFWRAGAQIIGGLDPNFTANAWGGPSYAGAMYCHYLDLALLNAAASLLLSVLVLPRPTRRTATADRRLVNRT